MKHIKDAISYLAIKFEESSHLPSSSVKKIRLCGGYGDSKSNSLLVESAMASAKKHGINLTQGKINKCI